MTNFKNIFELIKSAFISVREIVHESRFIIFSTGMDMSSFILQRTIIFLRNVPIICSIILHGRSCGGRADILILIELCQC